jgi:hypothetical protein
MWDIFKWRKWNMAMSLRQLKLYPTDERARADWRAIDADLHRHSPSERRTYIGVSGIGGCPREMYFDYFYGQPYSPDRDQYGTRGYLFEHHTKERLARITPPRYIANSEIEVYGSFAPDLFRGHTDGLGFSAEGSQVILLELKSTDPNKFVEIAQTNKPLPQNYAQVQMYLRLAAQGNWRTLHGDLQPSVMSKLNWDVARLIYVNVSTLDHWIIYVERNDWDGYQLEEKAKNVVLAIREQKPPECTCGWCRDDDTMVMMRQKQKEYRSKLAALSA